MVHLFRFTQSLLFLATLSLSVNVSAEIKDLLYVGLADGNINLCKPTLVSPSTQKGSTAEKQCLTIANVGYGVTAMAYNNGILYVGTTEGKIWTCDTPTIKAQCTTYSKFGSAVRGIVFVENRLYAITTGGTLLRCDPQVEHSCDDIHNFGSALKALSVTPDYIYVGDAKGDLHICNNADTENCTRLCRNQEDNNCKKHKGTLGKNYSIDSIKAHKNHVYVASDSLWKCDKNLDSCNEIKSDNLIKDLKNQLQFTDLHIWGTRLIAGHYEYFASKKHIYRYGGDIISCSLSTTNRCNRIQDVSNKTYMDNLTLGRAQGTKIYFNTGSELKKIPLAGGGVTKLASFGSGIGGLLYVEK